MSGIKTNKVLIGKPIGSSFSLDTSGNINIDGSIYLYGVPLSFSGGWVSQSYVDGSLALRDASINVLFVENDIQDVSISNLRSRIDIIDGSIIFLDSSINQLFSQKSDLSYVNQTFLRESSLGSQFYFQDGSLFIIKNNVFNGLTEDIDGSIRLGGTLSQYTDINVIQGTSFSAGLNIIGDPSPYSYLGADEYNAYMRAGDGLTGGQSHIQLYSGYVASAEGNIDILFNGVFIVQDASYQKGIQYQSDYSDYFVEESLISKRYADNIILDLSSLIDDRLDIIDGSINQLFSQKSDLSYVDSSLSLRDASISQLFTITNNFDISIGNLDMLTQIHEVSLGNLSLSQLEQDLSINALFIENDIQDASIENLRDRINIIDSSIIFIDGSINQLFSEKSDLSYVDGSLNQLRIDIDASFQSIELGLVEFLSPIDGTSSDVSALIVYANRQMLAGQPIYFHDPSDLGFVFDSLSTGNNYNSLPWIGINGGGSAPRLKLSGDSLVFSTAGIRGVEFFIEPGANVELQGFSEHARVDLAEIRFGISPTVNELTLRAVNMTVGRIEGQTGNSNLNIKDRSFIQCQNLNEIENVNIEGGSILFCNWIRINTTINVGWDGSTKTTSPAIINVAKPHGLTTGKINVYGDNNIITASTFPIDISIGATNNTILGQNNTITDEGTNTIILENLASIEYVNTTFLKEPSLGPQFYFQDGSLFVIDVSGSGGVSQSYVDGSLSDRDLSINSLFSITDNIETSLGIINTELIRIDGSLNFIFSELDQLDASIQRIDVSLGDYVRKDGDIMSGDLVIQMDLSVNGRGKFGELNVSGNSFPGSPSAGDLFFRPDANIMFVYDSSRGKWLSIGRSTLNGGRTTATAGSTVYIRVGDATQSSTAGYRMIRNGTITGFSIENNNTLTTARDIQLRVNDVSSLTRTIAVGQKGFNFDQGNVDFSAGDLIQVVALPSSAGAALNNWIALIEFGTRI